MPSGETRIRLLSEDGNNYSRTENCSSGIWQRAHHHRVLSETHIVEKGWIAFATGSDNAVHIRILRPHELITATPGISHNIYLTRGAVIHTVKHGADGQQDWNVDEQLTHATQCLSEEDIYSLAATALKTGLAT